jgi:hypothetical protein
VKPARAKAVAIRNHHPMARPFSLTQTLEILMLQTLAQRHALFIAMSEHLLTKDGPLRPERLVRVLLGVDWAVLTTHERRIFVATLARCGFDHDHASGPCWFRKGPGAEQRAA